MALLTREFRALGTNCEIRLDAEAPAETALEAAIAEIRRFEAKYSRYREDSVVSLLNDAAGGPPTPIDVETLGLLRYADECHRQSDGLFDITAGVFREVWHAELRTLPDPEALARCVARVGWDRVELTDTTVRLPDPAMQIDLGGIGKEYVADAAAAILRAHGFTHGLVNLGGDLAILGPQADGSPWWVGIAHPERSGEAIATIALDGGALTTSGSYERYVEIDGRRYGHVLDPRTGWPVEGLVSVSVVAPHALVAGTLSLIALLKGREGLAWLEGSGASYLAIDEELRTTGALAA